MGFNTQGPKFTRNSDAPIERYRFVLITIGNGVKQFDGSAGARADAVSQETVIADRETTIQDENTTQIEASGAVAEAADITTDTGGKFKLATVGNIVMGKSLQAATADGDITAIRLVAPFVKA